MDTLPLINARLANIETLLLDALSGHAITKQSDHANAEDEKYLTIDEVSSQLRISRPTIYKLMKSGDISYFRIGSRVRFLRSEIFGFAIRTNKKLKK